MKKTKCMLLLILCMALMLNSAGISVIAEGGTNFDFSLSKTALKCGDTFSVNLISDEMTVSSIVCGILFDNDKLSCVSIVGSDPESPDEIGINKIEGKSNRTKACFITSVSEANESGSIGAVFVSENDVSYAASEVFTVTFLAKAAGEAEITLYENTDGADGYFSDNVKSMNVMIYDANAASDANVYFSMDRDELAIGERVSVTLSSKEMTVQAFAAGISFDNEKLRCVSIVGSDPDYPNDIGLNMKEGKYPWKEALFATAVDEANASGDVAVVVYSISDETYVEGVIFTVTFEAVAEGEALFTLFEDSDGTDGYRSDQIVIKSVTVGGKKLAVRSTSDLIVYSVSGREVTIDCDVACKAGYLKNGEYIAIPAVKGTDSYSFTAPDGVDEVLLTLKGDTNLNGKLTALDIALINAHKLGKLILDPEMIFAGDANSDGVITDADIELIKAGILEIAPLDW